MSHPHENILSRTKSKPSRPFVFYPVSSLFFLFVCSSPLWLDATQCAYFSWEGLSFNLVSLCLLSLLYLSLSLMLSFDSQRSTFNGSYLLIKYLQVSAALWQGCREKERGGQRGTKRERAAAGVVQAVSDMTYSQIPCAKFELLMSPEANEPSTGTKGQKKRLSQYSPPTVIWLLLIAFLLLFDTLLHRIKEEERQESKEGKEGGKKSRDAEQKGETRDMGERWRWGE